MNDRTTDWIKPGVRVMTPAHGAGTVIKRYESSYTYNGWLILLDQPRRVGLTDVGVSERDLQPCEEKP